MALLASLPWSDLLLGIATALDGARLIDDSLRRWPGAALAGVGRWRRNARPLDGGTLVQVQPSCCLSQLNAIADTPVSEEEPALGLSQLALRLASRPLPELPATSCSSLPSCRQTAPSCVRQSQRCERSLRRSNGRQLRLRRLPAAQPRKLPAMLSARRRRLPA